MAPCSHIPAQIHWKSYDANVHGMGLSLETVVFSFAVAEQTPKRPLGENWRYLCLASDMSLTRKDILRTARA